MALVSAVLILALFGVVNGQSYAAEAEREAKRAACEQADGVLAKAAVATAVSPDHPAGEGHPGAGAEQQQQGAREKALLDAVAKCTVVSVIPDRGRLIVSFLLAGIGPVAALIALFLNGVRYEAGRGDDLLVAVLSEHADGRHAASWARFGAIDAGGAYEKREEGRLLSI